MALADQGVRINGSIVVAGFFAMYLDLIGWLYFVGKSPKHYYELCMFWIGLWNDVCIRVFNILFLLLLSCATTLWGKRLTIVWKVSKSWSLGTWQGANWGTLNVFGYSYVCVQRDVWRRSIRFTPSEQPTWRVGIRVWCLVIRWYLCVYFIPAGMRNK